MKKRRAAPPRKHPENKPRVFTCTSSSAGGAPNKQNFPQTNDQLWVSTRKKSCCCNHWQPKFQFVVRVNARGWVSTGVRGCVCNKKMEKEWSNNGARIQQRDGRASVFQQTWGQGVRGVHAKKTTNWTVYLFENWTRTKKQRYLGSLRSPKYHFVFLYSSNFPEQINRLITGSCKSV